MRAASCGARKPQERGIPRAIRRPGDTLFVLDGPDFSAGRLTSVDLIDGHHCGRVKERPAGGDHLQNGRRGGNDDRSDERQRRHFVGAVEDVFRGGSGNGISIGFQRQQETLREGGSGDRGKAAVEGHGIGARLLNGKAGAARRVRKRGTVGRAVLIENQRRIVGYRSRRRRVGGDIISGCGYAGRPLRPFRL